MDFCCYTTDIFLNPFSEIREFFIEFEKHGFTLPSIVFNISSRSFLIRCNIRQSNSDQLNLVEANKNSFPQFPPFCALALRLTNELKMVIKIRFIFINTYFLSRHHPPSGALPHGWFSIYVIFWHYPRFWQEVKAKNWKLSHGWQNISEGFRYRKCELEREKMILRNYPEKLWISFIIQIQSTFKAD